MLTSAHEAGRHDAGPTPGDSTPGRSVAGRVVTLRGERELLARAGHLFDPRTEFMCGATDLRTWWVTTPRGIAVERLRARIHLGVEVRKMYTEAALAEPDDAAHLSELAGMGVLVRISGAALAYETIVIDRRVAILAGAPVEGVRGYSVVTAPEVVAGIRSLFLSTWQGAVDLADYLPAEVPAVDDEGMAILRLLSAGRKDETAAREVGLSVRTYRRRVAELMTRLGAESRFQAGVRARALGLRP